MNYFFTYFSVIYLASGHCLGQTQFIFPDIKTLQFSIEHYYQQQAEIQILEVTSTKKYRWLSYLPNPGYSPFTGGFTMSLNLLGALEQVRISHTQKSKIEAIKRNNNLLASDLKNSVVVDYNKIQNLLSEFELGNKLDSLNLLTYELALKKYKSSEITPSEFIATAKSQEIYTLSRQKEEYAIYEAITNLIHKAKMDVPAKSRPQINFKYSLK